MTAASVTSGSATSSVTPPPSAPPPAADLEPGDGCPLCGTARTGRFCEVDGYDFMTATLMESAPAPVSPAPVVPEQRPSGDKADRGPATGVTVSADRAYYETVRAAGGPDADTLVFPDFSPERQFPLRGSQVLVGRRSRSRGINPEIDLTGPPEDPGISHAHALFLPQADGWAVVDLGSANGTYVNDPAKPIPVRAPITVRPGDKIYAGAWTVLTVT
jgi:hypothetical protein